MAIIKQTQKIVSVIEIDTNTFTREQWIDFIHAHVSSRMMTDILCNDEFTEVQKFERLKDKAIAGYQMAEEIASEFNTFTKK